MNCLLTLHPGRNLQVGILSPSLPVVQLEKEGKCPLLNYYELTTVSWGDFTVCATVSEYNNTAIFIGETLTHRTVQGQINCGTGVPSWVFCHPPHGAALSSPLLASAPRSVCHRG